MEIQLNWYCLRMLAKKTLYLTFVLILSIHEEHILWPHFRLCCCFLFSKINLLAFKLGISQV